MKQTVTDIQDIRAALDEEDEQLMRMFPRRREAALDEMLLVRNGEDMYLLRKADVARRQKILDGVVWTVIGCACVLYLICAIMSTVTGYGHGIALESVDWTDNASRNRPEEVKNAYDSQIAKLEAEINTARRYQKKAEMSGVGNRNAQNYDPEFAQRSQFHGSSERSRYINDPEAQTSLRNPAEHPEDYITGKADYSQFGYALMSQEQRDIYNYWDSYDQQNGTDKASANLVEAACDNVIIEGDTEGRNESVNDEVQLK